MTTEVVERRATFGDVFSVRAFRVLFTSRCLAIAADTLRVVALSVLVFSVTGSTLLSAITFGIGFMPQVAGGLLFGALADRLRPRPLITTGYLLECVAAAVLATVPMPVGAALAIVAFVAALTPIFNGASSRLVAEVLTGDAYVLGRSVTTMSAGAAQLIGMALGGLAVGIVGPKRALLIGSACHLVAALVVRLRLPDLPAAEQAASRSAVRQSWSANAQLLADAVIRRLLLIQWLPSMLVVGAEGLVIAYAAMRGFPPGAGAMLLASVPGGMLLGQLVVGRFTAPAWRTRLVAPLLVLLGAPVMLLAADPPFAVTAALLTLTGFGFGYPLGLQKQFLDALPEANRGQAFGLLSMGLMTLQGIGPLIFGLLGEAAGIRAAMFTAGAAIIVIAIFWWHRHRGVAGR